jgi:hypothetical protein
MISNCANPNCSRPFRLLGEGRLFVLEPLRSPDRRQGCLQTVAWLCSDCARQYTIVAADDGVPVLRVNPVASNITAA